MDVHSGKPFGCSRSGCGNELGEGEEEKLCVTEERTGDTSVREPASLVSQIYE